MDWRAMSRSRSRVPMDWRSSSRSRSRPPIDLHQHDFHADPSSLTSKLPTTAETVEPTRLGTSPPIPIPGSTATDATRSSSILHPHLEFPEHFADATADLRLTHTTTFSPSLSSFNSPVGHPSSLPSTGLHGFTHVTTHGSQPTFPRHVRKTSFDHTVAKEGILAGLIGRHQVNGRPRSPESLVGTKRRADAPHAESMLRGDLPPGMEMQFHASTREHEQFDQGNPFPSTTFNFTFPNYDTYFEMPSNVSSFSSLTSSRDKHFQGDTFTETEPSSLASSTYSPTKDSPSIPHEGLSAAAVAASAAVAEGYAQLHAANLANLDDSGLDYQHFMGFMYPHVETSTGFNPQIPFTHVDPTQILPAENTDGVQQSFHASPSSDGWGLTSSANASPEPYNASAASTPPSIEGAINTNTRHLTRKIASTRRVTQELQRKKPTSNSGQGTMAEGLRSSNSTPDLTSIQHTKGGSEDGEPATTICRNCRTTNTPLWRRDPEGQPLCTFDIYLYFRV
jgi:GATA-binding protein, other eukaryote